VFVGGLRESEDAVHITEEELATYFAKFGVIESVSINRDDRTQRGRGFAFVKFFQEVCRFDWCFFVVLEKKEKKTGRLPSSPILSRPRANVANTHHDLVPCM